ncbi:class I SAM-dependent methyltransferase [Neobacillus notoginsengisoli]|uniref:Class I SAM-dependent methyltransferase n=1 Tax=Neobacillus notoginsengisoli TaxID=1578198 RepID=A0A417YUE5_9BACI|nr:class I SAM-dependent methyltransferase [Neobacillus notoginsengisoli]RHW40748.1 class I SAM-dependent methyltransferase [Neobacillus notoginsengisoli]
MKLSPVEQLFTVFNETTSILQEELSCTYLEALAETGENLFHGSVLQEEISEINAKRLKKSYEKIHLSAFAKEDIRKAFQLAILKGMKENVQPNHQMTPDSVGMLIGYLVQKFVRHPVFRLLDPAVGTGNLLTSVTNQQMDKQVEGIGMEIDDVLIKLAYVNANLQEQSVQLFHQDSLQPIFIDPVDAVIADLPVGYYPDDERAAEYKLAAAEGHSYAHHLFIEQSINATKPGGYLFFVIPNGLFESPEAPKLRSFFKESAHIQGILQLPLSMFKSEKAAKSILILQKAGEDTRPPKEALLVNLPALSNPAGTEKILTRISQWISENK